MPKLSSENQSTPPAGESTHCTESPPELLSEEFVLANNFIHSPLHSESSSAQTKKLLSKEKEFDGMDAYLILMFEEENQFNDGIKSAKKIQPQVFTVDKAVDHCMACNKMLELELATFCCGTGDIIVNCRCGSCVIMKSIYHIPPTK